MTEAAANRHRDALRWKNLWGLLVFFLGILVVGFLAATSILLIQGHLLEGAISGFSSLLSGGGFAWVWSRWTEVKKDEQEAFRELTRRQNEEDKKKETASSRTALLGAKNV